MNTLQVGQILYRIQDTLHSVTVDADLEQYATEAGVRVDMWRVTAVTARGAWISKGQIFGKRFMRTDLARMYAYPDMPSAVFEFTVRKNAQISVLQRKIDHIATSVQKAYQL